MYQNDDDPIGDTASFQAFQDASDPRQGRSTRFRVVSLLIALVVFGLVVALLLQ